MHFSIDEKLFNVQTTAVIGSISKQYSTDARFGLSRQPGLAIKFD
jgi:hypothetical protein